MKDVELLIEFICDLVDDEFSGYLGDVPAKYYFLHGGCLEFAKVLNHFVPHSFLMINQTFDHFAIKINDDVYDCTGKIEKEKFNKVDIDFLEKYQHYYGIPEIKFEKKEVSVALISELNECSGDYVKKLVKQINNENPN